MGAVADATIGADHAMARSKDITFSSEGGVGAGGEAAEPAEEPKGEGGHSSKAADAASEGPQGMGETRGGGRSVFRVAWADALAVLRAASSRGILRRAYLFLRVLRWDVGGSCGSGRPAAPIVSPPTARPQDAAI